MFARRIPRWNPKVAIRPWRDALAAAVGLWAAALLGVTGVWWSCQASLKDGLRQSLIQVAQSAAAVVDVDLHGAITSPAQTDGFDYERCCAPLRAIHARLPDLKYVYTLVLDGETVRFVLDTSRPGDRDGDGVEDRCEVWSAYDETDPELLVTLRDGRPNANMGPFTDKRGTFVSGFAPLLDAAGRPVGAVGVDMAADGYVARLTAAWRWAMVGLLPAGMLSVAAGFITYQLRRRARHDAERRIQQERQSEESEVRLRTLVDAIPAGVILVDRDTHKLVDANPAALAMYGAPRAAVIGAFCHQFICPAERGRCPVTDLGEAVHNSERVLLAADGRRIPVLKTVVPVTFRGGSRLLLETFVDISDRERAGQELKANRERLEEEVRQRTQELMEAERQVLQGEKLASVGRLAAGVAHEINTPIQYVHDNLHALADSHADIRLVVDKYRELVALVAADRAHADAVADVQAAEKEHDLEFLLEDTPQAISQGLEGVQRVAAIVRAMKDFSHVQGGAASSADLNRCLESTLTVARNEYKYVADVETDFGELPTVECWPSELNQVFLNILINAAHAIQDTGRRGKITVATHCAGEHVEIVFTDTGVGIPEEIRNKIYEPFFTTKEVGRGSGQGLAIAHQIVVGKHAGQLSCDSTVGVGTTFRIRLPVQLGRPASAESEAADA